ncbi:MAG: GatB/YqeY domain-containing protein [Patescibacteria group bacterium]
MITKLREEMKVALKAHEELKLSVIRSLITALTNELVAKGRKPTDALTDEEALAVFKRAAKQRTEAAEQFKNGNRPELAEKELAELALISAYLPARVPVAEIERVAREKIAELGITDASGMGKLMGAVIKAFGGAADGGDVKDVVSRLLS